MGAFLTWHFLVLEDDAGILCAGLCLGVYQASFGLFCCFQRGICILGFRSTAQQFYKHHRLVLSKEKRLRMRMFILVTGTSDYFQWVLPV